MKLSKNNKNIFFIAINSKIIKFWIWVKNTKLQTWKSHLKDKENLLREYANLNHQQWDSFVSFE